MDHHVGTPTTNTAPGPVCTSRQSATKLLGKSLYAFHALESHLDMTAAQMPSDISAALDKAREGITDDTDTVRFPLSMGPLRPELDHKGDACSVIDVVFNSDVLREASGFRYDSFHVESGPCPVPYFYPVQAAESSVLRLLDMPGLVISTFGAFGCP